ncbi:MAG: 50S ribosomal protein L3 [Thermoplasmata archaeon]|nr:50S ribosomal protein L3 [Thermoplasmata archaeon]MCI4342244.1 50S ribosomal protein L3 [Thermoplasmata archaeon]
MARRHRPRRGSLGFSPRSRSARPLPRIRRWPEGPKTPTVEGFAGFKVGMTHAFIVDYRKRSTTAGQEVSVPVTVVETPPIKVAGCRLYHRSPYGMRVVAEVWGEPFDEQLLGRMPAHGASEPTARIRFENHEGEEVRLLAFTQPSRVTGVPSNVPELFELRVSGEDPQARRTFALGLLGKELPVEDLAHEGEFLDVIGVTKGKGFQGHIKRWGVKLQPHKNSKHRRMIGTLGPHNPSFVSYRIPQAGQMGYHRRTIYNIRVLRVVKDPRKDPVTPLGGFPRYGEVRNACLLLHGSLPGPTKRLLRFRTPMRLQVASVEKVDIRYLSTRSKQGA